MPSAIRDEDVRYLWLAEEPRGGLFGSTQSASRRADDIPPLLQGAWSGSRPGGFVTRTSALCLSSLPAGSRNSSTCSPCKGAQSGPGADTGFARRGRRACSMKRSPTPRSHAG